MKENKKIEEEVAETAAETAAEQQTTPSVEELFLTVEALRAEIAEKDDRYLRMAAEYDNYRKRSAKEKEGIYSDAYADIISQVLPILDNMERALQYKDAQGDGDSMAKGLEMIMNSFSETLAKMGVAEIEALGKQFDPNIHNAVMHIDDEAYGENEIVEVFMKGYIKGDKVLRHSMVKVAN